MFQDSIRRFVIDLCFVFAIVFNFYYLSTTHFEFMISLFHYQMFNISALSYTFMRFVYMVLPVFLLVPALHGNKPLTLERSFYLLGILYILGSTWIIYFLFQNPISMLWTDPEATKEFLQLNALNSDYLIWDSYDLFGILFSLIQAALYISVGYFITRNRKTTVKLFWISVITSMLLPALYVSLSPTVDTFSSLWLKKNTVLFASGIFTAAGLTIASSSRGMWSEMLWQ